MTWLIMGVLLWTAAHLFKRVLPEQRARLGAKGRPLVAVLIALSVVLMIVGYRETDAVELYALPYETRYLNNLLMLVALFLMDAGRVEGVVRTKIRHSMLLGLVVWAAAHLLVNGNTAALVLFGGLALWAGVQMALINRAEGPWQVPAAGSLRNDAKIGVLAVVLFAVIAGIHHWLDRPAFVLF